MVAHNVQGIELKAIFLLTSVDGVEQNFAAFVANQSKVPVVAANGNVIAIA